ncbi:MAG: hypothetical protein AAF667_09580 [Pseudomonadota bacterium]
MQRPLILATGLLALTFAGPITAEAPVLQSDAPVIYLADNLGEADRLGWCIDTVGRGFADILQAHSCKPSRGQVHDTQYSFDAASGQIRSAAFDGKCVSFNNPDDDERPFGLLDCQDSDPAQAFVYDAVSMEIRIGADPAVCMVVAPEFGSAGPFQSRILNAAECASVEEARKQWIIKN